VPPEELALEFDEEDVLSAGMAHFRCREFARAAHALSACSSAKGRFLWLYSQYLVRPWDLSLGGVVVVIQLQERPTRRPLSEIGISSTVRLTEKGFDLGDIDGV
jgi:Anaphase promoting complex subunit 8 / Cdc23